MFDFIDPYLDITWLLVVLLVGGFYLLVKGADWLVDGASSIAKRMGVSELIIGLTVVAFGTSMPEFVVNMISAGQGNCELAITNILGSNAINIFVILGLTALIWPVSSERQSRTVDLPVSFAGAALIFLFACLNEPAGGWTWRIWEGFDIIHDGDEYISGIEGVVLLMGFLFYMMYLTREARLAKTGAQDPVPTSREDAPDAMRAWVAVVAIVGGLFGLTVGGELCVKTATKIASNLGVSDAIIGLTVVALGTSLPELATSVIAAAKKNSDLALGNCVGSCIFNVFFVLSISSCVHPLQAYEGIWLDALMAFAGPALTWLYVINDKKHTVSRLEGASLLIIYAIYLSYRLMTI